MYIREFEKWLNSPVVSNEARAELMSISKDDKEIQERFSASLSFGTAGLRGIMRQGMNGMNEYTVRLAAQAMSDVIRNGNVEGSEGDHEGGSRGVTIAFDSRNNSERFAWEAAAVLAANGIPVYIFESLRPTPELSFALRQTGSIAGINITASHNTKEYNGFKAYWEDGAQIGVDLAAKISGRMEELDIFRDVRTITRKEAEKSPLVTILGDDMDDEYVAKVMEQSVGQRFVREAAEELKIVYTPFHGTGYKLVPRVLEELGMKHVLTVHEQMVIDGDFPTVKSPNPEYREGFDLAVQLARKEDVDLIIGTDPDGDRCGITVRDGNDYRTLTGNQVGVLLLDYIIRAKREEGTLRDDHVVIKSIVSTTMADAICRQQNVQIINVLTGFKYIGEKIKEFEASGDNTFLFGFEESNGYLTGTYARDKDAVLASMLIAEMACYHHIKGRSLAKAIDDLYETYGHFREKVISFVFEGLDGKDKMKSIMEHLREEPPEEIGLNIKSIRDYKSGTIRNRDGKAAGETGLPQSDILFYELEEDCTAIIRPSGTEPKIKFYIMAKGNDPRQVQGRLDMIEAAGKEMLR